MGNASDIRNARGEFLRPLYHAAGEITATIHPDSVVYRRGTAEAEGPVDDTWTLVRLSVLLRWHGWLQKARLGTLRWLAAQEGKGRLAAGDLRCTAAVRSQLSRAGLVKPSELWGDEVTEEGERIALWARFEVDRRQK